MTEDEVLALPIGTKIKFIENYYFLCDEVPKFTIGDIRTIRKNMKNSIGFMEVNTICKTDRIGAHIVLYANIRPTGDPINPDNQVKKSYNRLLML